MIHNKSAQGWEIIEVDSGGSKVRVYSHRPKNLVEMLKDTVKKNGDTVGFICDDRELTFAELDSISDRIAVNFKNCGVTKGDRVSLLVGIGLDFPLVFFGLMKIGAVAVPLNTRFKGDELAYEINDSMSKLLVVDEEYWPVVEPVMGSLSTVQQTFYNGPNIPEGAVPFSDLLADSGKLSDTDEPTETDTAVIMYSSGTTGKPKGAILHHRGLIATAMQVGDYFDYQPHDKLIGCVPLFHVTGLAMIMLSHIFSGIACIYLRTFETRNYLDIMASEKITKIISVINILWLMVNHPDFDQYDFSSFEAAMCGGSPATTEMVSVILKKLPNLRLSVGYGLTESCGIDTATPWEDVYRKIDAVGRLMPLVDAKIVDDDGNDLPTEGIGEILLRSAKTTKGYWNNPRATEESIVDEWLHTGDIGKIDDEGFLYILDRKKDMVNRGGEKVYSLEVENVISKYAKVLEVAVVGVPDKIMGEAVKAVIGLRPGETATADEIKQVCADQLADYKVPKYVEFMELLPRNPAGKVIKNELKDLPEIEEK